MNTYGHRFHYQFLLVLPEERFNSLKPFRYINIVLNCLLYFCKNFEKTILQHIRPCKHILLLYNDLFFFFVPERIQQNTFALECLRRFSEDYRAFNAATGDCQNWFAFFFMVSFEEKWGKKAKISSKNESSFYRVACLRIFFIFYQDVFGLVNPNGRCKLAVDHAICLTTRESAISCMVSLKLKMTFSSKFCFIVGLA